MKRYDVIAKNQISNKERVLTDNKTKELAESIVEMAVIRNGTEEEIFFIRERHDH